jgi:hypothetical protein
VDSTFVIYPGGSPASVDAQLGYQARTVIVDNLTSQYVLIPDAGYQRVPPYTPGYICAIAGTQRARASFSPPDAITSPPPNSAEAATIRFYAAALAPSPQGAQVLQTQAQSLLGPVQIASGMGTGYQNKVIPVPSGTTAFVVKSQGGVITQFQITDNSPTPTQYNQEQSFSGFQIVPNLALTPTVLLSAANVSGMTVTFQIYAFFGPASIAVEGMLGEELALEHAITSTPGVTAQLVSRSVPSVVALFTGGVAVGASSATVGAFTRLRRALILVDVGGGAGGISWGLTNADGTQLLAEGISRFPAGETGAPIVCDFDDAAITGTPGVKLANNAGSSGAATFTGSIMGLP